ncbi:hypothetical protein CERSUDRAFT_46685, partial [Gelatoporia subvermispora B]
MSHKFQGLSMSRVIVEFESYKGTEALYVMASRAMTLDRLLILQPFRRSKISCCPSCDRQLANNQLDILWLQT